MKKFVLAFIAMICAFVANAQGPAMRIEAVHPDLGVKVTRSVVADNVAYVDLEMVNYAVEDARITMWCWNADGDAIDDNGIEIIGMDGEMKFSAPNFRPNATYSFDLVPGVKKKVTIQVYGISKVAEMIARLRISIKCSGGINFDQKKLVIRNIPLNR